jgi:hypothetical protein
MFFFRHTPSVKKKEYKYGLYDRSLPQSRIALSAKNHQEKKVNRQGNDPRPKTVKQTHSRIEDKGNWFPCGFGTQG